MRKTEFKNTFSFLLFLLFLFGCENNNPVKITELKCESLFEPVGIDIMQPNFSWIIESTERGQAQKAYQIIVADNKKDINRNNDNFWDSKKIESGESFAIQYKGKPLLANQIFYWKVKIWDKDGQVTKFSKTASFTTSITELDLWQSEWIGAGVGKDPINEAGYYEEKIKTDIYGDTVRYNGNSLLLRNSYQFEKSVEKALVHICGLGLYELTINGKRVGKKVLNPAKTHYNKIVLYDTYEVAEFLNKGENVLGIMLGNGWFNPVPKWWSWRMQWFGEKRAMLQMHVTFKDGSTQVISTNTNWKMAEGPVRRNCIYEGETYNANKEIEGWNLADFDDSAWVGAKKVNPPGGELRSQIMPPIQQTEILKPIEVTYPADSLSLVDFGQNFPGWIKINVTANKGDNIIIKYAEDKKDGMLDPTTNHRAVVVDTFIAKGGNEIYEPRFTYHGFQFAEISGLDYKLQPENVKGIVIHSAITPVGTFECSHEGINKIHDAVTWSQWANLMGYPTDCPQREERLGWIGDAHVTAEEAIYNFDMNLFYKKWLTDIRVNQNITNGYIPYIAPRPISKGDPAFSWSCGYHLITWYHYKYYSDVRILKENYSAMKKYVDYLSNLAEGYILPKDKYGDWVSPLEEWKRGEPMLTSTAFYYYAASIVAKSAHTLGNTDDELKYNSLSEEIKKAFNKQYYNNDTKCYGAGSQFENSFALFLELVPENEKGVVLNSLIEDIKTKNNSHITTGILGTKYLMELLSQEGRSNIAWELATQTTYPSWLNMLEGHNTMSEHWGEGGMNSHNHVMFGSIDSWFYKTLAGIQVGENTPDFKSIVIKPFMHEGLEWVKSSVKTIRGTIRSEWTNSPENYNLKVSVPVGTEATVYVLADKADQVTESNSPINKENSIIFLKMENKYAVFRIGSGDFHFISHLTE